MATPAFDDAVFIWNPGDADTASFDEVSEQSASGTTEGSIVSVSYLGDTRTGREYDGAVGSRFALGLGLSLDQSSGFTIAAVVQTPADTDYVTALWFGEDGSQQQYAHVLQNALTAQTTGADRVSAAWRNGGGSPSGSAGWAVANDTSVEDDHLPHVLLATFTHSDGTPTGQATVRLYRDGTLLVTGTAQVVDPRHVVDRVTVGRTDDSTPFNSGGGRVFAAAVWARPLTGPEVTAVTADPFNDPAAVPNAPTDPSATALSASSIRVDWTAATGSPTGHRVERSLDGSTGWTNVSGSLGAAADTFTDTGLTASTQYFYRVVAFNADGDSSPSSTVNATTDAGPTPPPPGSDRVLPSPTTMRLVRGNGR